jgi:Nucleotide modification associated domain 2
MKLYSYIVTHDTGFAPNPFYGFCTLACCKPEIRRVIGRELNRAKEASDSEQREYWIVGLSPRDRGKGNKVIFFMRAEKAVTFDDYFKTKSYSCKKPDVRSGRAIDRCGDNIYRPIGKNKYGQLPSLHSKRPKERNWNEDVKRKRKDLSGKYVLISRHFSFFGSRPIDLPANLRELIVGRGSHCNFSNEHRVHAKFLEFVHHAGIKGVIAPPKRWKAGDMSWKDCS